MASKYMDPERAYTINNAVDYISPVTGQKIERHTEHETLLNLKYQGRNQNIILQNLHAE